MERNIEEEVIYEKLMQYKEKAANRGYSSVNLDQGELETLERTRQNYAFRELKSNRKIIGKWIIFFKRIVRKCLKWYIEPICFQQTEFNTAATSAISNNMYAERELQKKLGELGEKIELEDKRKQEKENTLTDEIEKLKAEVALLNENFKLVNQKTVSYEENFEKLKLLNISNDGNEKETFSQSGEDIIIDYILRVSGYPKVRCSYLDIGANHAKELSNTYFFYKQGIRGVLVEANPALIPELKLYRSEDAILNLCISETSGDEVPFYVMSGDGLSTSELEAAEEMCKINPELKIEKVVQVKTISIRDILDKHFVDAPTILNIDIEGKEMEILRQIDFEVCRPLVIIAEMISYKTRLTIEEKNKQILEFLQSKNYAEYAFTGINSIFVDKRFFEKE